mgnify:CR=1 FL=1
MSFVIPPFHLVKVIRLIASVLCKVEDLLLARLYQRVRHGGIIGGIRVELHVIPP